MKRAGLVLWFVCTASWFSFGQDDVAAVKTKIAALEGLWNQAYKAGDIKALDGILDDGIVLVNDDGSMQSKAEFLASVKSVSPQQAQQQQVAPESTAVHLFGPHTAVAVGVMRVKGVENGKPYVRRERFIDTWILKEGRWVCVATDATPIQH
ncbi:MAG TPA: nuclear transport factor 2 family protein [Terriglobales bacterium]|nr:nuclear transport factor 2 family protein [Terriglobales bacterium]